MTEIVHRQIEGSEHSSITVRYVANVSTVLLDVEHIIHTAVEYEALLVLQLIIRVELVDCPVASAIDKDE